MSKINITYRLFALTMALLMFVTSVGFSIDLHICQDHVKSASLFGDAPTCYELAGFKNPVKKVVDDTCKDKKEHQHNGTSIDKKECCHNEALNFQSNSNQVTSSTQILSNRQLQQFVIAYVAAFIGQDLNEARTSISFALYKPPLIPRDIPVLVQSFLL